jgi:uncharacterized Zn finger protein
METCPNCHKLELWQPVLEFRKYKYILDCPLCGFPIVFYSDIENDELISVKFDESGANALLSSRFLGKD